MHMYCISNKAYLHTLRLDMLQKTTTVFGIDVDHPF